MSFLNLHNADHRFYRFILAGLGLLLLSMVVIASQPAGNSRTAATNIFYPLMDGLAFGGLLWAALATRRASRREGLGWGVLALAQMVRVIVDLIWSVNETFGGQSRFFAFPYGILLFSFLLFFAGVLIFPARYFSHWQWTNLLLDLGILVLTVNIGLRNFIWDPVFTVIQGRPLAEVAGIWLFPLGGQIVAWGVLLLVYRRLPEKGYGSRLLYAVGMACLGIADTAFFYLYQKQAYVHGSFLDFCYFSVYLLLALAGVMQALRAGSQAEIETPARPEDAGNFSLPHWLATFPYLGIALVILIEMIAISPQPILNRQAVNTAFGIALSLVIIRQFNSLQENMRLNKKLNRTIQKITEQTLALENTNAELGQQVQERRLAEHNASDLARLVEESPNPVVRADFDGNIIYTNPVARNLLDTYDTGENISAGLREFINTIDHSQKIYLADRAFGDRHFSFFIIPVEEAGYLNIYGVNVSRQMKAESLSRQRAAEFSALYETSIDLAYQRDLPKLFETILERVTGLLHAPCGFVLIADPVKKDLKFSASVGLAYSADFRIPFGKGMAGMVASTQQPMAVDNYSSSNFCLPEFRAQNFTAMLEVPLLFAGDLIGVLGVAERDQTERKFDQGDIRLMSLFASIAASAVHNTNLFQQVNERAAMLAILYDAGLTLNSVLNPQDQLKKLFDIASKGLACDRVEFLRFNPDNRTLNYEMRMGYPPEIEANWPKQSFNLEGDACIAAWSGKNLCTVNLPYVLANPLFIAVDPQVRSGLWVPIHRSDMLLGVIGVFRTHETPFSEQDEQLLSLVATQAAIAIENGHLFEEIRNRAAALETIEKFSLELREARTLPEIIPLILRKSIEKLDADGGILLMKQPEGLQIVAAQPVPPNPNSPVPFLVRADFLEEFENQQQSSAHLVSGDADFEKWAMEFPCLQGAQSILFLPIKSEESTFGMICLGFCQLQKINPETKHLYASITEILGIALQRTSVMDTLEQRVVSRTRELEALYDVAAITNANQGLELVLSRSLEKVAETVGASAGIIHLLDEESGELRKSVYLGIPADAIQNMDFAWLKGTLWNQVIRTRHTTLAPVFPPEKASPAGLQAALPPVYLGTLIQSKGAVLGVLSIFGDSINQFAVEEIGMLEIFGQHIAVVVERDRLRKKAEKAAAFDERQNLARDLHDSVTQSLFSLYLLSEAYRKTVRQAGVEQIESWLAELGEFAHLALKEMRLLLYQLSPVSMEQDGLIGALRHRLEAVESKCGIKAHLISKEHLELPGTTAREMFGIAQEALNNTLKHAAASQVTIRIEALEGQVEMSIEDDGRGFEPEVLAANSPGMGLRNMQARAKKLGGVLTIQSSPEQGTHIQYSQALEDFFKIKSIFEMAQFVGGGGFFIFFQGFRS